MPMLSAVFYAAALSTLRFVEHRAPTGRRFGDDADARWRAFRGHLTTADRIDLLLRDADVEFPGAFGPRTTFALRAVAEDEPFGAEWSKLPEADAETLWRKLVRDGAAPTDVRAAIAAIARAWELPLAPVAAPDWLRAALLVESFAAGGPDDLVEQLRELAHEAESASRAIAEPNVRPIWFGLRAA